MEAKKVGKFVVWACKAYKDQVVVDINGWYERFFTDWVDQDTLVELLSRKIGNREEYEEWIKEVDLMESNIWAVVNAVTVEYDYELEELAFLVNICRRTCEDTIRMFEEYDPLGDYIDGWIECFLGDKIDADGMEE